MEHESDCGAPVKGLVELRDYGSYPSFLVISYGTCNHFFTWLSQGQRLSDKLEVCPSREGVYIPAFPQRW